MKLLPPKPPVAQALRELPPDRDAALDFARGGSLAVVVFGHFLMAVVYWSPENVPMVGNTLSSGSVLPYLTWLLQIMPLFFIAGGAVDMQSWVSNSRKPAQHLQLSGTQPESSTGVRVDYAQWLWGRVRRLLRPVLIYLIVMSMISAGITVLFPQQDTGPLLVVVTQILWFIGAYIPAIALTPVTYKLYKKAPHVSLAAGVLLVIVLDVLRLNVLPALGVVNFVVVWTVAHQLGYFYKDGRVNRKVASVGAVVVLGVTTFVTAMQGWYPVSMVGLPTEPTSNMAPPSVAIMSHTFFLFFVFVLIAPWLNKMFHTHVKVAFAVLWVNLTAMTLYLWHMPLLVALFTLTHFIGWDRPVRFDNVMLKSGEVREVLVPDGGQYWLETFILGVVFVACLYVVVRLLWPLEHISLKGWDTPAHPKKNLPERGKPWVASVGVVGLSGSVLALAATGFTGFPTRVIDYAGLPLNNAVAIVVFIVSAYLIRACRT